MNDKVSDQNKTESQTDDATNIEQDSSQMIDNTRAQGAPSQSTDAHPQDDLPQNQNSQKQAPRKEKQPAAVSKIAVLSFLVSTSILVAIGGAGWYVYKNHQTTIASLSSGAVANQQWVDAQIQSKLDNIALQLESRSDRTESELRAQFETQLLSQQASSSARADGIESALVDLRTQSSYSANRLDNLSSQLQELKGTDRNVWLLAEAEYLMRLANQRLITMRDIKSAQSLLTQTESLLTNIDEYGLINVRQALANDIAALRGTNSVDPTNAWLTLNTLANRINTLPIINVKSNNITPADEPTPPEETVTLQITTDQELPTLPDTSGLSPQEAVLANIESSLQATGHKISTFAADVGNKFLSQFLIRKDRENVGPVMMSPDQELFVRQNLRLMIEQAQLALLQRQEEIYHASMNDIRAWLDQWFIEDATEVMAFREMLIPLIDAPVTQEIPDISSSLSKLKIYVNEKLSGSASAQSVSSGGR